MSRVIPCLFSLIIFLSYPKAIYSFEFDPPEGYELADLEEEGIETDEEEVELDLGPYAKSLFKPSSNEASDSNHAMATLEAGPSAIVAHCVNAVSGDFFDSYTALTVPGPQPLVVQCSYCSSENKWSFQHMPDMEVGFSKGQKHLYARYVDDSGSGMTYRAYANESYPDGIKGRQMTIPSVLFEKGLTNCGSGEISGQTNWRNSQISFVRKKDEKFYMLRHGMHVDRIFSRFKRRSGGKGAPLGKFRLDSENHPNGNQLIYQYYEADRLSFIKAVNKTNQTLADLQITYPVSKFSQTKSMKWKSHNSVAAFDFNDKELKRIERIAPSHAIPVSYKYDMKTELLKKKYLPEDRFLEISYYDSGKEKNRVRTLRTPIGTTHTFNYFFEGPTNMTTVKDAEQHLTAYYSDKDTKRLQTIVRFDNKNTILSKDSFYWSDKKSSLGNLIARTFESDGKTHFCRTLGYDAFGNVTIDQLYGNLTGKWLQSIKIHNGFPQNHPESYAKTYRYTQDGRNLLLEENDGQKTISCAYHPRTQLLEQRLTKCGNKILKREFFEYDENGVMVKEIWDDGQGTQKEDLSTVTERHVKLTTPRKEFPIGLPEIVEERYLDLASNQYLLLKKTIYDHTDQGKVRQEDHYDSHDNFAYRLKWEYDRLGNIIEKTDALSQQTLFRYDENGNKIWEEGPRRGWHKEFVYDLGNRLRSEKEVWPNGEIFITSHRYNKLNQRTATIDSNGNETTFDYNALGHLVRTQGPLLYTSPHNLNAPFEETEYDAMGNAIAQRDANGNLTKTSFTIRGKPYLIEFPDSSIEQKEYSFEGLLIKEVAKNGLTTQYTHDPLGRVIATTVSDPQGQPLKSTLSSYSTFHLISETDEDGTITSYEYDGAGRRVSMKKGDHSTRYEYDSLGRTIKTIESIDESDCRVTCKVYDLLDRVIEERIEDGHGQIFKQEQYAYDVDGNRTSVMIFTDAGIAKTETEFNPEGKPVLITDALGNQTRFTYDHNFSFKAQRVSKITKIDPLGNQEVKIHDTHGNVCCQMQIDPFGMITQHESSFFDALGNKTLSQIIVYQGKEQKRLIETAWQYDAMGNMTYCTEAKNTPEQKITRHHYNLYGQKYKTDMPTGITILNEYDTLGRLSAYRTTDNTVHYLYNYDIKDHPILIKDLVHATETQRSYDQHSRLLSETLDNGITLSYTYDHLDRPTTVILPDHSEIRYRYNAHHLAAVERIKGNEVAYIHQYGRYDLSGNVMEETLLGKAGTIRYHYDLLGRSIAVLAPRWEETIPHDGFDAAGNLLKREVVDKQGILNYTFAYDSLYQLISEKGFVSHTYQNDSAYNRIAKDNQPYAINALNQLLEQTNASYHYDDNGNLIEKIAGGESTRFVYDALDRLIEVHHSGNVTTYAYDSFHRRLSKTCNGQTTRYFYHNQNEIGAFNEGKISELRVLGITYGAEIGGAVAFELGGNTYAPIHDPQGNVVALLDPSGNLAESYRYTAFGETEVYSEKALENPWRFSSKRLDTETGFLYFGRRYYSPNIGRWITPDPAGYADGPNLYAYVHNHPLAYIDPDGQLAFFLLPIAISLAADYCLPAAVAMIEPYAGAMIGSFLTGVVKGYNLDISSPSTMTDPVSGAIGMSVGALFNLNPAKAGTKAVTNASKALVNTMKREAAEMAANVATSKGAKLIHWFKSSSTLNQATQKTSHIAETYLGKGGINQIQHATSSVQAYTKSNLRLGQQMHKSYKEGMPGMKEFRLPSGRRIDFVDPVNGHIYELKPFNPRSMKLGEKQLDLYKKEIKTIPRYKNTDWKTILETY